MGAAMDERLHRWQGALQHGVGSGIEDGGEVRLEVADDLHAHEEADVARHIQQVDGRHSEARRDGGGGAINYATQALELVYVESVERRLGNQGHCFHSQGWLAQVQRPIEVLPQWLPRPLSRCVHLYLRLDGKPKVAEGRRYAQGSVLAVKVQGLLQERLKAAQAQVANEEVRFGRTPNVLAHAGADRGLDMGGKPQGLGHGRSTLNGELSEHLNRRVPGPVHKRPRHCCQGCGG
mmetsp:Transcript_14141/g.29647  ORF Transcript_14141/g.29647 Transcript_14141/m.29647 type:complete len:235 (+) Transcript_14141:1632-2336(+)